MKENMTVSGTHDNEPWNFVESTMTKLPGFTKISVYYFFKRCEVCDGIDQRSSHFWMQQWLATQPALVAGRTTTVTLNERMKMMEVVAPLLLLRHVLVV
jgi:hypothetical protein